MNREQVYSENNDEVDRCLEDVSLETGIDPVPEVWCVEV
jgi:hypothetical protein